MLFCDPGGIRTHDPQLRRLLLYPTELPDPIFEVANIHIFLIAKRFIEEIIKHHCVPYGSFFFYMSIDNACYFISSTGFFQAQAYQTINIVQPISIIEKNL